MPKTQPLNQRLNSDEISIAVTDSQDRGFVEDCVVFDHSRWITRNPNGSLGDLLKFLDSVRHELYEYDSDELIVDHIDDLGIAAEYLVDFGHDNETFEIRTEGLEEDIELLEDLIFFDGASFRVADLPTKENLQSQMVVINL